MRSGVSHAGLVVLPGNPVRIVDPLLYQRRLLALCFALCKA
jgi:hypothetical protein